MDISVADLLADYRRAKKQFPFIEEVEEANGLPALLLYAVGSRETNLKNVKGDFTKRPGDSAKKFHGFGVWQRDCDAFGVDESYLRDVRKQAEDAAELLAANFRMFGSWNAAIAAYNCGPGNVRKALRAGHPVDRFTAHGNYSTDVLQRHAHLVAHVGTDLSIADEQTEAYLDKQFDSIRGRIDRALQRIGGRSNALYNDNNENFQGLVMAKEALIKAEEARRLASAAAEDLKKVKSHLHIR